MKQAPGVSAKLRILRTEQAGLPSPFSIRYASYLRHTVTGADPERISG